MHPDIEKLINIAKECGGLTTKQREIILKKAKVYGIDDDEIEFYLESTFPTTGIEGQSGREKRRKCPNCGAVISDNRLTCPECGYVFGKESNTGKEMRDYVKELEAKLQSIDERNDIDFQQKEMMKSTIIGTFTVPTTKEALIQLFTYSYGSYVRTKDIEESILGPAWLGRARNAYLLLKSQPNLDSATRDLLNSYAFIEGITFKQKKAYDNTWWFWLLLILAVLGIFAMVVADSIFGK